MTDFSDVKQLILDARAALNAKEGLAPVDERTVTRVDDYLRYALSGLGWFEPEPVDRWTQDREAGAL